MRPRTKRRLALLLLSPFILVIVGGLIFWFGGQRTQATVRRWIGQQLVNVANNYLNPQLSFSELDYHYPRTVILTKVRLTADDPATPGAHVDILTADQLTLELAEIPRTDQPLRIQKLILDRPQLRLISSGPGRSGLVGFSHLLRETSPPSAPTTQKKESPLSRLFQIRLIQITDGLLLYDPRLPNQKPMRLDQLNTRMDVQPTMTAQGETDWYTINLKLQRTPVLDFHLAGRINLDTMSLDLSTLHLAMTLGRDQDHYLPPELQKILRDNEVTGQLNINGHGLLPLKNWQTARLNLQTHLTNGNIAVGSSRWPVQSMDAEWNMADRVGKLAPFNATLLGGKIQATGKINLTNSPDASLNMQFNHIRLEQTLRNSTGGEGEYRGDLSGQVTWNAPLNAISTNSKGGGELTISNGRLITLPIIAPVLNSIRSAMKVAGVGNGKGQDTAQANFTFQGNKINFSNFTLTTDWSALRGRGDVFFNKQLDLRFNAGPIEKAESVLGGLGRLLGGITDQLAVYLVKGTLDHPQVDIKIIPAVRLPDFFP